MDSAAAGARIGLLDEFVTVGVVSILTLFDSGRGEGMDTLSLEDAVREQSIVRSAAIRDRREKARFRGNDAPLSP